MSSRARSNSHSRAVKPQVVTEGVDLCAQAPSTELQHSMIEKGRATERVFLRDMTPSAKNDVTWTGEFSVGGVLTDTFRVTSGAPGGFMPNDERTLKRRYKIVDRGETNKIYFVSVPQSAYDKRVMCLDLDCSRLALVAFLVFLITMVISLGWPVIAPWLISTEPGAWAKAAAATTASLN
jgi:hypothetical protein